MNNRLARSIATASAVTAIVVAIGASAQPASHAGANVDIVVNGQSLPLLRHDGRFYVEALKEREYAIRLRNPYPVRAAVALSVDGLNTIDARETTARAARKWVLQPYQTVVIRGWQISPTGARRFEFTTEARSYGTALGKTDNLGVISAAFFRERQSSAHRDAQESADRRAVPRQSPEPQASPSPTEPLAAMEKDRADEEYAATGMGRRTGHVVTRVWLDLEESPGHAVSIRYEFRPQLVRLGILPDPRTEDPLRQRERAQGFTDQFAPVPPSLR